MNYLHKGDLPDSLNLPSLVAVDTETMGLSFDRDRLCLVQVSFGDKSAFGSGRRKFWIPSK